MHRRMIDSYDEWVANAPEFWRKDGFLEGHLPMAITCAYGQNQPIGEAAAAEEQALAWNRERDYSTIRYVSIAIATDIW
jgi:hypothetical protein